MSSKTLKASCRALDGRGGKGEVNGSRAVSLVELNAPTSETVGGALYQYQEWRGGVDENQHMSTHRQTSQLTGWYQILQACWPLKNFETSVKTTRSKATNAFPRGITHISMQDPHQRVT